jgi:CheY-like chemotaxis protein
MEPMLRRLIGEHIEFDIRLAEWLDAVVADKPQMEQVLMNLAINARDAMPRGGRLTIRTSNVELDEAYARTHVEARVGKYVMFSVADSGEGMDAETLEHVFEPFFTTKPLDKGVGLGLPIVYGIMKQSGGHVTVESRVGQGTTICAYLPGVKVKDGPQPPPSTGTPPGGGETVLLCEDEDGVRYIARIALSRAGYTVLEAADGREALELARAHSGSIDLLVTDLVMPQMTGRELAAALRVNQPQLGVIVMSGYSSGMIDDTVLQDERLDFLVKPFQLAELLRLVRAVLDRAARR